ncbi:uncharacterized protein ACR2FA_010268 [Aphomia sociella]
MVLPCCVAGCNTAPDDVTYFEFPTSRLLRRRWLDAIKPVSKVDAYSKVCSAHFEEHDYETFRGKIRLKGKVVPSIFNVSMPVSPKQSSCNSPSNAVPDISNEVLGETSTAVSQDTAVGATDDTEAVPQETTKDVTQCTAVAAVDDTKEVTRETTKEVTQDKLQDTSELDTQNSIEEITETTINGKKISTNTEDNLKLDIEGNKKDIECESKEEKTEAVTKENAVVNEVNGIAVTQDTKIIEDSSPNGDVRQTNESSSINNKINKCIDRFLNNSPTIDINKDDIEDILTNYHIKQTKPLHKIYTELEQRERECQKECEREVDGNVIEIDGKEDKAPVFIEVSVNQNNANLPAEGDPDGSDCLMLLESVQVEVDPNMLMLPERESEDSDVEIKEDEPEKKTDPISLLTSSDEDEVIIEEPHIDTVEVSDETDEDDVPLVKLVKSRKKAKKRRADAKTPKTKSDVIAKIMWGNYDYYCVQCHFRTTSRSEFKSHTAKHSTVLQICQLCNYTTASKLQLARHKRKHKDEKKFKCHLCDYKARHNMSLIYHLKSHDGTKLSRVKKGFKCERCGFKSDVKSLVLKHVRLCDSDCKKYCCDKCIYETKRRSDLKRHKLRRHKEVDLDDEYAPEWT